MKLSHRMAALFLTMALLLSTGITVYASELGISGSDVSASDTSSGDVVSASDHLAMYPLEELKIREHRLSMLVPRLDGFVSANSTGSDIDAVLGETWGIHTRQELLNTFDYSSGTAYSYLYTGFSANNSIYIYVVYQENAYTEFVGSYSGKSAEELEAIRASTEMAFGSEISTLENIHGNTYVYQEGQDAQYGYYSYALETIINGGRYNIYIDMSDATSADKAVAESIVHSLRIGGKRTSLTGMASSRAVTVLSICTGVLFLLVCLLAFFLIRFSLFSRAAGSSFNILGFSMPPSKAEVVKIMKQKQQEHAEPRKGKAKKY